MKFLNRLISASKFTIKHGINPHQDALIYNKNSNINLLNGNPSYINYLDAINSWNLVSNIKSYNNNKVISTSFKHTTPTGLSMLNNCLDSFIASRNIDPVSSYGDFIAISDIVDEKTAKSIKHIVSDGIIANGFTNNAYDILSSKKNGNYVIFNASHDNSNNTEIREMNGLKFILEKNNFILNDEKFNQMFNNLEINNDTKSTIQLAYNILSYIPSNSISIAYKNNIIGVGAGQQNRVDCIKIAGTKALQFLNRNNIDVKTADLVLASDGFLPFIDNIEECAKFNIKYIIQPGGSIRDKEILKTCEKNGIKMLKTGIRMFHH
tara:strand:- start:1073 stop:2038 length:966 start_codon:yes stop_codon:yes gene_type:complete